METSTSLLGEVLVKIQNLEKKLEEKLTEMKEQLEDQADQITEQVETKLRRLERQLQDQNNKVKWELLAELMIVEQNFPLPQEIPHTSTADAEVQVEELRGTVKDVGVQVHLLPKEVPEHETADAEVLVEELPGTVKDVGVHLLPKEEEKTWEVCGEKRRIQGAVCRRARALIVGMDGTVEFYSSGKVVGRYLELQGVGIEDMFCSVEYIGMRLEKGGVACYRWFSDRLEWLYRLYMKGLTWRKAGGIGGALSEIELCIYSQAQDTVCCLKRDRVSGWSLSRDRTTFIIKVLGARYLRMTPYLVLVEVRGGSIEVFTLKGTNLYSIQVAVSDLYANPPLNNTDYTALVSFGFEFINIWPTSSGQPVTNIKAFHSAFHPHLPHLCSSVQGKPWEVVVRDVSTNSVIWRRPQSGSTIQVFSIDSQFLLVKADEAPVQILRWSSGEVVATVPVAGDIWSASSQYIVSNEQVLYRSYPKL